MYSKIANPKTGRRVSITGKLGKTILKNYLLVLSGGADMFAGDMSTAQILQDKTKRKTLKQDPSVSISKLKQTI